MLNLLFALLTATQINTWASSSTTAYEFQPTIIRSLEAAKVLQNRTKSLAKSFAPLTSDDGFRIDSQCFHRATVWQYLLDQEHSIRTQKVFVFYTHKFRQQYKRRHLQSFGWWFHVAPMILVRVGDKVEERVIDPTFADYPLTIDEWTSLFVDTGKKCRDDMLLNQFTSNVTYPGHFPRMQSGNSTQDCFVDRAPMYDLDPEVLYYRQEKGEGLSEWDIDAVYQAAAAYPPIGARGRFLRYVNAHK